MPGGRTGSPESGRRVSHDCTANDHQNGAARSGVSVYDS